LQRRLFFEIHLFKTGQSQRIKIVKPLFLQMMHKKNCMSTDDVLGVYQKKNKCSNEKRN